MANDKREKLLNTVRSMMARANDPRTPEDERDTASRLVSKWIAKHQIEANELRLSNDKDAKAKIVMFRVYITNKYLLGRERADALANAVVRPFGGNFLRTNPKSAKVETRMTIFCSEDVKDALEVLLTSLLLQMESGLDRAVKEHRQYLRTRWYTEQEIAKELGPFRAGYLAAFGWEVSQRVKAGRKEALDEARFEAQAEAFARGVDGRELANVGKELALVDDSARTKDFMDAWFEARWGKKIPIKNSRKATSYEGQRAGREDGRRADIGLTRLGNARESVTAGSRG